jgi:hypothetical protein
VTIERFTQYWGVRYLSLDAFEDSFLVSVSSHENDPQAAQLVEHSCGLDAVTGAIQINVNYRDIGRVLHRKRKRLSRICGKAADIKAQLIQIRFESEGNKNFIFNDECAGAPGGA